MKRTLSILPVLVATLALVAPVAVADAPYGREYSLRTLDARVAEVLVWDICEEHGKTDNRCQVQVAQGRNLVVLATREVHSQISRMLLDRDSEISQSQAFQITLVRRTDGRRAKAISQPDIVRALDAVRELFPHAQFEIVDQGLIRTANESSMRLGTTETGIYDVRLRQRSAVTRLDSQELTVELELIFTLPEGGRGQALSSVLTVPVGETIVAGSSRMTSGEETMLVILKALPSEFGK